MAKDEGNQPQQPTEANANAMPSAVQSSTPKPLWQRFRGTSSRRMPFPNLFRYAAPIDILYMVIGVIASCVVGVILPLSYVIFGHSVDSFTERALDLCALNFTALAQEYCPSGIVLTSVNFYASMSSCNFTGSNFTSVRYNLKEQTRDQINLTIILAILSLVCEYLRVALFNLTAERQTRSMRQKIFRTILSKEILYFDSHKTGELNALMTSDIDKIRDGIGDKLSSVINTMSTFLAGVIIALAYGWKLALAMLATLVIPMVVVVILSKFVAKLAAAELTAYGKAGAVAEEVISSIRTVFAYNGQEREIQRYEDRLGDAKKYSVQKDTINGCTLGMYMLSLWSVCALGFWYEAKLIQEEGQSIGNTYTVFLGVMISISFWRYVSPQFQALLQAVAAAENIQRAVEEPSDYTDDRSDIGLQRMDLTGDIHFSNVCFSYPTRTDISILNNFTLHIKCGQTVALVGPSGSGKSTCVQLLQRFYHPTAGQILIDGKAISEYNLPWLRQQIGVVSQEPVLFHTTIRENILFGCDSATDEQIHYAAQMANAHDFIMCLPDKYDTMVGERGTALSGGQKQRIAIARALIRNPKILLLDEATSALDNESEAIVQDALDRAAQGRTTLVIAHRLSTIRDADRIAVLNKGEVVEDGDHQSLMQARGIYFDLVEQQILRCVREDEELQLEERAATEQVVAEQSHLGFRKDRSSTVVSVTPSILTKLYGTESRAEADNIIRKKKEENENITVAIFRMNKPEWLLIGIGCLASMIIGGLDPMLSVFQANFVSLPLLICIVPAFVCTANKENQKFCLLMLTDRIRYEGVLVSINLFSVHQIFQECDRNEQKRRVTLLVGLAIGLGVVTMALQSLQGCMFARSGGNLTQRLRSKALRAILCQELAYFDNPKHSTGVLCTRLATEASAVQGASGVRFGFLFQNFVAIITGVTIGLAYSWQLSLLILAFFPLVLFTTYGQIRLTTQFDDKCRSWAEDAGKITVESIQSIRTVLQLTKEDHFYNEYSRLLEVIYRTSLKRIFLSSLLYSVSSAATYFVVAAILALGTTLVDQDIITFKDMFMSYDCVTFTAFIANQALILAPDYEMGLKTAKKIFNLLTRKPAINNQSKDGEEISDFAGQLDLSNVYFVYPSRPESIILRKLTLTIKSGQKVAFVGSSGAGKSTIVQLLERFYDANVGSVCADSKDIRSLNLHWYRSQIGIVSQEPILFDISIRENISYGDNSRKDISLDEIIEAAKNANIHDFIQLLPDGYETVCGAKGVRLSGGQKQRIAIARALLRNPKILLLDEATSALDSESEKLVQQALDRAQLDRTSITIAHRLSTIQNCDMIYVMHHGMIAEHGTHDELLAHGGRYYRLAQGKLK